MRRFLPFLPAILILITLFLLSHRSSGALPQGFNTLDKEAHFIFFFILSASIALGLFSLQRLKKHWSVWFILILSYSIIGALDEFHQSFVPHREVSFGDWTADFLGGTLFVLFLFAYVQIKKRMKKI